MQSEKGVINYEDNTHDPDDLMFQTEIDVSTKKSKILTIDSRQLTLEESLNLQHTKRTTLLSQFNADEDTNFKNVIRRVVKGANHNEQQIEVNILNKMKEAS